MFNANRLFALHCICINFAFAFAFIALDLHLQLQLHLHSIAFVFHCIKNFNMAATNLIESFVFCYGLFSELTLFCVEVLGPCQQLRSCRAGQLPINTVPGQA